MNLDLSIDDGADTDRHCQNAGDDQKTLSKHHVLLLNMNSTVLSPSTQAVIENYLHLPFPERDISCPEFVNRRQRVRGSLRALVGKGSPDDIVEETAIIALKEKIDLKSLDNEKLKQFLVDHHIGLDCSALVYYDLDAESQEKKIGPLKKQLKFPYAKTWLRKLITLLRPVENADVQTFAHEKNSVEVRLNDVQAGDMIIMLGTGPTHDRDHVLLIHEVRPPLAPPSKGGDNNLASPYEGEGRVGSTIHYTHSLRWSTDGKYNHGVRQGQITIVDPNKSLVEQAWLENGQTKEANETWQRAKSAESLSIRRLRCFASASISSI